MSGTRTAPDATGALTTTVITLHLMDASGDFYTDSITTTAATVAIDIEAWAAKYQLSTQATLWKITQSFVWEGDADADNAETDQRSTIAEGINVLYKNIATNETTTSRLIAPVPAAMQGNQDIPIMGAAPMSTLVLATLAVLPGFSAQSAQFTGRRERKNNPRISI